MPPGVHAQGMRRRAPRQLPGLPAHKTPTYQAKQLFALKIEMKVQQQKDSVQARTAPRRLSGAQDLRKPALRTEGRSLPPCAAAGAHPEEASPGEAS